MWYELLMTSAISGPLWGVRSHYAVRTECGMFVMYCMQCCMFVLDVLYCVDVLSRGGIYMFSSVICLVLLMCTLTI